MSVPSDEDKVNEPVPSINNEEDDQPTARRRKNNGGVKRELKKTITWLFKFFVKVDTPLKFLVLTLQVVSLVTTVEGAKIIFPPSIIFKIPNDFSLPIIGSSLELGEAFGITIQFMLVLLLLFDAAKASIFRRWFSIIVLTLFSIYGSFFSIYDSITRSSITKRSNEKAIVAHQKVRREIYSPLQGRLEKLKKERDQAKSRQQIEEKFGLDGRPAGQGNAFQDQVRLGSDLDAEINALSNQMNEIKFLKDDVNSQSIDDIYLGDKNAISNLYPEYLQYLSKSQESFDINRINRAEYGDAESLFLLPLNKISQKSPDINAVFAILIATVIDGLAVILGTIPKSALYKENVFRGLAIFFSYFVSGFRRFNASIQTAFNHPAYPFSIPEVDGLKDSFKITCLKKEKKGSEILQEFLNAIDKDPPHFIDMNIICNDGKLKSEYSPLFRVMQCSPLYWVKYLEESQPKPEGIQPKFEGIQPKPKKIEEWTSKIKTVIETINPKKVKKWHVSEQKYSVLITWLIQEIARQLGEEEIESNSQTVATLEFEFSNNRDV
jgi:hypothetical protein